jgi:hypothetical protein
MKQVLSIYIRASQHQMNEYYERYHTMQLIQGLGSVWTSLTLFVALLLLSVSRCGI